MDDPCGDSTPFNAPLSIEKADRLIERLSLPEQARVVDIGCGRGEFLLRTIERYGVSGTGVDPDPRALLHLRGQAAQRVPADRLRLLEMKAEDIDWGNDLYDAAFCIGSTHVFGTFVDSVPRLCTLVKPGGLIVLGDLYWLAEPPCSYQEVIGDGWPRFDVDFATLAELGESKGLTLLYGVSANQDEWDHFEGVFATRRIRAALADQRGAESQAAFDQAREWYRAYMRWGRVCMGFGYFVYQVPGG